MSVFTTALVVLVPLVILAYISISLLRLGLTPSELTETSRQKLVGFGFLMLFLVVIASLVTFVIGTYCFLYTFQTMF